MLKNDRTIKILDNLIPAASPGIQYVVVDRNFIVFEHSNGFADIKNSIPLGAHHLMAAFSMTKTLTAIAILQLVEREVLKLDNQVSQYIKHPYNSKINIRQLVSHTSGIPNPIPLQWTHLAIHHEKFNENEVLSQVLRTNSKTDDLPGKKYKYSNIGYWLLGKDIKQFLYQKQKINSNQYIQMSLGWHIDEMDGSYYYKEGGGAGFHCEMRIYPDHGLASVVMVNRTSFNTREQLTELDKSILNA